MDLDLLRRVYEAHNAAGAAFPEVLGDYLRPDVEFVETAAVPGARAHRGREAVVTLFRDRFDAGAMRLEELELVALDDHRALASFRAHMRGTGSGAEASMRFWNLITLDADRIARIEEFTDETAALDAAGP
jgi:ketosteroid isomerase-like protein